MNKPRTQGGVATRTKNKLKRRQHILEQASTLIAQEGLDAFTLSELASTANVTVPTIHNLIGTKADLCNILVEEMLIRVKQIIFESDINDPIRTAENFVDGLLDLYRQDEDFYRAAYIIGDQHSLFEQQKPDGLYHRSFNIAHELCVAMRKLGMLNGEINSTLMAKKILESQRVARHDWVHGYIDISDYKPQILTGMLMTFAADATQAFKSDLIKRIAAT